MSLPCRTRARALGVAASGVLALALVSCTPTPAGPPVVVLFPGSASGIWGTSATVLRGELESDGYAVEVRHSGDDIPAQLLQLRDAFEAEPTAIVIAPIEATALAAELARSDDPDVAIISYDRLIRDAPEVDYFATFDHAQTGRLQAQSLLDALALAERDPELGPAHIELIAGSGDDPAAQAAFAGAMEVLQPLIDARTIAVPSERTSLDQTAVLRGSPATAANRVGALLEGGIALDGILSPHDAMSAAIAERIAEFDCAVVALGGSALEPTPDPTAAPTAASTPDATPDPDPSTGTDTDADADADAATQADPCRVVLTGGGTSRAGARAMLAGQQSSAVFEDPRELARVVASMVSEVVRGIDPAVTHGAVTDNGAREVPTLLLEPVLLDVDGARRLTD